MHLTVWAPHPLTSLPMPLPVLGQAPIALFLQAVLEHAVLHLRTPTPLPLVPQMCSREEEAAARRRMVDAWRTQGKSDREIEGLLDCKLMQRQAEALERRINQHTADAGASLEDLEVRGGVGARRCGPQAQRPQLLRLTHPGWRACSPVTAQPGASGVRAGRQACKACTSAAADPGLDGGTHARCAVCCAPWPLRTSTPRYGTGGGSWTAAGTAPRSCWSP